MPPQSISALLKALPIVPIASLTAPKTVSIALAALSKTCMMLSASPCGTFRPLTRTVCMPLSADCNNAGASSTRLPANAFSSDAAADAILGRIVVTSCGTACATTGAKPSTRLPIPPKIVSTRGRMFFAAVPTLSTKLSISPPKSCVSSATPTSRFFHDAFIMPTEP